MCPCHIPCALLLCVSSSILSTMLSFNKHLLSAYCELGVQDLTELGSGAAALSQLVVQGWESGVVLLILTAELQHQHPLPRLRHPACHVLHQFSHPGGMLWRGLGEIG